MLRLARLTVASEAQGKSVGRLLLRTVFTLAWRMADDMGCVCVVVDAKPGAVRYYLGLGFRELEHTRGALGDRPQPTPMFLALAAIPKPAP